MGKNVAVFVDVANIFYAAKAAGVDIDYVTLLKAAIAGRDFVRAYAYTGLDPDNENQRNFHSFLSRHGYKVVSKDIRKYGDGKVKANLDIELVVDMMKTARNLDVAIVVSGDGDFAPAIRAIQEMGVRVEVISFRGNTSSDLIEVADQFSDITQLARVERSGRSGRRVADDEFDLSMTEVPDKQTEGTGAGRSSRGSSTRGRGRGRGGDRDREPAVAASAGADRASGGDRNGASGGAIIALPGEKLSGRVARSGDDAPDEDVTPLGEEEIEVLEEVVGGDAEGAAGESGEAAEGRRRRRRGGRGRGRGRGREEGAPVEAVQPEERPRLPYEDEEPVPAPRGQRPTPFGSIWDSQLGVPASPPPAAAEYTALPDDDEEDEPEIPEYLLAERRGGRGQGGPGGQRGGQMGGRRAAYAAALDRERFGRGAGSSSRYQEPMGRPPMPASSGGGQRPRPDQPPRGRPDRDRYQGGRDRVPTGAPPQQRRGPGSDEPWSEVPPEIEELLRAQLATRKPSPGASAGQVPTAVLEAEQAGAPQAPTPARGRGRGRPPAAAAPATAPVGETPQSAQAAEEPAVAAPATRGRRRSTAATEAVPVTEAAPVADAAAAAPATAPAAARRRKSTPAAEAPVTEAPASAAAPKRGRRPSAAAASDAAAEASGTPDAEASASAPAKRTRSSSTVASDAAAEAGAAPEAPAPKPATRRRTTKSAETSA